MDCNNEYYRFTMIFIFANGMVNEVDLNDALKKFGNYIIQQSRSNLTKGGKN